MHIVDSAPDGLVIDWEDGSVGDVGHDCCSRCDTSLCLEDMDCRCGLPKYDDHEGSVECDNACR